MKYNNYQIDYHGSTHIHGAQGMGPLIPPCMPLGNQGFPHLSEKL